MRKENTLNWGESQTSRGVTERDFTVTCKDRSVPGVLWTPEDCEAPTPLVLIGHGGNGHKREDHLQALARRFVRHNKISAATIDGPIHGDRMPPEVENESVSKRMRRLIGDAIADSMIVDWKATLDALQKIPEIGIGRVGYWGLSMGTIFGLPFVAAEPRIEVAVLGLMGAYGDNDRLLRDAADVKCPVLFLQQWGDELIPRDLSNQLFEAIGTDDKRLHANTGTHAAVPRDELLHTQTFLATHLGTTGD